MHEEGDHATKKQLSGSLLQGDGLEKRLEQWECILHDQHGRLLPQRLANGPLPHHHFAQICRKEEAPLLLSPHTSKKAQLQNSMSQPTMSRRSDHTGVPIDALEVRAYQVPTDAAESDGTYEWRATTLVVVEITAGGTSGLGYTYADTATATLIRDLLEQVVRGRDAMNVAGAWSAMAAAIRNLGRPGIASMAISAVDTALWDLKARLLELPLVTLLGAVHDAVAVYGSGGFTSYTIKQLQGQLAGWVASGIARVKMKIGRDRSVDSHRVLAARQAIGNEAQLFVDANGAYSPKRPSAARVSSPSWG